MFLTFVRAIPCSCPAHQFNYHPFSVVHLLCRYGKLLTLISVAFGAAIFLISLFLIGGEQSPNDGTVQREESESPTLRNRAGNVNIESERHVFLTKAFLYPSLASLFEISSANDPVDEGVAALLIHMDKAINVDQMEFRCVTVGRGRNGSTESKPVIKHLHDDDTWKTSKCRLWSYALTCPVQSDSKSLRKHQPSMLSLKIANKNLVKIKNFRPADSKPRGMVVCPGRMFAYDQWHKFVTAMEFHRLNKVDLVVAYIKSVEGELYRLINAYRDEGWLTTRPSVLFPPSVPGLGYDPNAETTWDNQLVNFHECLYEFRASARFIAFPDWDELMVGGLDNGVDGNGWEPRPVASVFQELIRKHPDTGSFYFQRVAGRMANLEEISKALERTQFSTWHEPVPEAQSDQSQPSQQPHQKQQYDDNWAPKLDWLWAEGVRYSREFVLQRSGKIVALPKRLIGLWVHNVSALEPGYRVTVVPRSDAFIVHARNHQTDTLVHPLSGMVSVRHQFQQFVRRNKLQPLLCRLPNRSSNIEDGLNAKLKGDSKDQNDLWRGIRSKADNDRSQCYSFAQFNIPRSLVLPDGRRCVNAETKWHAQRLRKKNTDLDGKDQPESSVISIYQMIGQRFLEQQRECLI